jgi:hypothetical protein
MLCPPTFRPLITTIQTVRRLKDTTQKHSDHVTLSPKSGWIVRPTEILTLRPQKVGCSVTVEHYIPLVFLVLTVCDTASPILPCFSPFSPLMLGGLLDRSTALYFYKQLKTSLHKPRGNLLENLFYKKCDFKKYFTTFRKKVFVSTNTTPKNGILLSKMAHFQESSIF